MTGDQVDTSAKSCRLSPFLEQVAGEVYVTGPIWRGEIEIVDTHGSFNGKVDGLEVFMPKTSCSKAIKSMQPSIWCSLKSRHALWPKHFDEVGATPNDIELFMVPEVSRRETDYNNLVEHMIANDLAMTSDIGDVELIIFTSLEQKDNLNQIQGKYYLWGIFKGKGYQKRKTFRGKKTNAETRKKKRSKKTLGCAGESNISPHSPLSRRIALSGSGIKHGKESMTSAKCSDKSLPKIKLYLKKMSPNGGPQTITTAQKCDFIPSLSEGCKKARSKKHRLARTLNKEGDISEAFIAYFPDQQSQTKTCTNVEEVPQAEQHSWDSDMEIDELSDSPGIDIKEIVVENHDCDSDMEIDEPRDDVVKVSDCVELQEVSNLSHTTDAEMKACLTLPFLNSKEFPISEVPNPTFNVARDSCSDGWILSNTLNVINQNNLENTIPRSNDTLKGYDKEESDTQEVIQKNHGGTNSCLYENALGIHTNREADNHLNVIEDTVLGKPEISAGLYQLARRVDVLECKASDALPEMESFQAPLLDLEESGDSGPSSSDATVVLKLNDEDELSDGNYIDELSDDAVKGLYQLARRVDVLESKASDALPELESFQAPLLDFEESGDSGPSSSDTTVVLKLNDEDELSDGNYIDELSDDAVKDCIELPAQINVSHATEAKIKACLTPFLYSEKFPLSEVPNPAINATRDSCSDGNPVTFLCNTANANNQNSAENTIPRSNDTSTGYEGLEGSDIQKMNQTNLRVTHSGLDEKALAIHSESVANEHLNVNEHTELGKPEISAGLHNKLATRVVGLESQASDVFPEMESCRTLLLNFEERGPSSSDVTVVLELNEEDEEETSLKGTEIVNEESDVFTTSSMLNTVDSHETSCDVLHVQVGRYTIKSDLAPILSRIENKYGDIGSCCSMNPEIVLEEICKAYRDLEAIPFIGLRSHHINRLKNLCQFGEALEIDVKWLSKRSEDLERMALQISQLAPMKEETHQLNNHIQSLEEKLKVKRDIVAKLLKENQSMEEENESLQERRLKLHSEIDYLTSKSRHWEVKSLVDGLF